MRTAEQILETKTWSMEYPNFMQESEILEAMEEYSKEVALDVLKWFNKTNVSMDLTWASYQLYKQQQETSSLK